MAWRSSPNGKRYYYRTVKKHGRAIRLYCGTGEAGERAAAEDQMRRQDRQQRLNAQRELEEQWQAVLASAKQVTVQITLLTSAVLTLAGYHRHHRGAWRRNRNGKTTRILAAAATD